MPRQAVVVCVSESGNPNSASKKAIDWILADPMGLIQPSDSGEKPPKLIFVHITSGVTSARIPLIDYVEKASQEGVVASKFEISVHFMAKDKFGVGHTLKVFCYEHKPFLLVAGLSKSDLSMYLARCDNCCPVLLVPAAASMGEAKFMSELQVSESPVQRETKLTVQTKSHRVFLSVEDNEQSDQALSWLRGRAVLRRRCSLFLVHGVQEEHQRQAGRSFLDSYSTITQGDREAVLGALVDTKGQPLYMCLPIFTKASPPGGCILQVIAPNATREYNKIRIGGTYTSYVVGNFSTHPILLYKSEKTAEDLRQSSWSFKLRGRNNSVTSPRAHRSQSQGRLFSVSPLLRTMSSPQQPSPSKAAVLPAEAPSLQRASTGTTDSIRKKSSASSEVPKQKLNFSDQDKDNQDPAAADSNLPVNSSDSVSLEPEGAVTDSLEDALLPDKDEPRESTGRRTSLGALFNNNGSRWKSQHSGA
eukprot:g79411.t1